MKSTVQAMFVILCASTAPSTVFANKLHFCWSGANGFSMTGQMQVRDGAMSKPVVTEKDVLAFSITGYRDGQPLGGWDVRDLDEDTTWHLRFDPVAGKFLTGGGFAGLESQGWNADGKVQNCGNPGFGFNSGNLGQDVCVNGEFVADSTVDPANPIIVSRGPTSPLCEGLELYGKR